MRVLVIDDSRATRMILQRMLEKAGCEVYTACDGRDALARLEEINAPSLALVDWNMPEMDGFEFVQAVRADPKYNDMQLMMVTAQAEFDQVVQALQAGANEYVMKPFTKEVILDKMRILGLDELDAPNS